MTPNSKLSKLAILHEKTDRQLLAFIARKLGEGASLAAFRPLRARELVEEAAALLPGVRSERERARLEDECKRVRRNIEDSATQATSFRAACCF
jgi:hypothetical protein